MTLSIHDHLMTSDATNHVAAGNAEGWGVSCLPGRRLDRNQAITAMTLAEEVATGGGISVNFGLVRSLAAELDLLASEAVALILNPSAEGTTRSAQEGK